ncbi:glutamate racemase [Massilia glaciei]|uniref:Glutamate racemase n=1 Tax=Massilia glaciei TaxID=1524097 RepID=A0A2U2HP64_9BURK|nr:glutamate racemase [Massilia glaciei]PWF49301.1 glutamate racemase [Massilia glaciei]
MSQDSFVPLAAPVGVFDSGVGGLSVLRHIRALLPHERLVYFADSGFAPYGGKPESVVVDRALSISAFLIAQGAKALVVACNTATVAAIKALRARYPLMPIVGVEPGLKPASLLSRIGKVGVLATELTLSGEKFLQLRDQINLTSKAQFILRGCPGLVEQIERGELDSEATLAMLEGYIVPLLDQDIDTLVLGCTHYPFVRATIEKVINGASRRDVVVIDTGEAVARQLLRLLEAGGLVNPGDGSGAQLEAFSSANASALSAAFLRLLGLAQEVREVRVASIAP